MVKTSERWQLVAAISITISSFFGAWHYAQPALSSVPPLEMPGVIFVGVAQEKSPAPVRVDIDLRFSPSTNLTSFDLIMRGDYAAAVPAGQVGELVIGFCGAIQDVQLRRTSDGEGLKFNPPTSPTDTNPRVGSIGLEYSLDEDCVITVINPTDFRDTTLAEAGIGWAVSLEGDTPAPTEAFAGSQRRYAFPRIATATLPAGFFSAHGIRTLAVESEVSIVPEGLPPEYVSTISSPQVEDPTAPAWSVPIQNADKAAGFRLAGVDQRDETEVQRKLFLASAAAGIAGGGLIWVVGALASLIEGRRHKPQLGDVIAGEETDSPSPVTISRELNVHRQPTYLSLIAASILSGVGGATLTWLVTRRKR